jgi:hypothetical protein
MAGICMFTRVEYPETSRRHFEIAGLFSHMSFYIYSPNAPFLVRIPPGLWQLEGQKKKFFAKESVAKAYKDRLAQLTAAALTGEWGRLSALPSWSHSARPYALPWITMSAIWKKPGIDRRAPVLRCNSSVARLQAERSSRMTK